MLVIIFPAPGLGARKLIAWNPQYKTWPQQTNREGPVDPRLPACPLAIHQTERHQITEEELVESPTRRENNPYRTIEDNENKEGNVVAGDNDIVFIAEFPLVRISQAWKRRWWPNTWGPE